MTAMPPKMPANADAERAVLGAALLDNGTFPEIAAEIRASDFFTPSHQVIFTAMADLIATGQAADPVTVCDKLMTAGTLDTVGGIPYISELFSQAIPGNWQSYAEIVRARSLMRQIIKTCNAAIARCLSTDEPAPVELARIQREILQLEAGGQKEYWRTLQEVSITACQKLEERQASGRPLSGIATGFPDFDWYTSGLQRGDLVITGARPSMGKTAFAMCIAEAVGNSPLNENTRVAVFSLEMGAEQLAYRELARRSSVPGQSMRNNRLRPADYQKMGHAVNRMEGLKIALNESAYQTPTTMRAQLNQFVRRYGGVDLIIVDYLQLMASGERTNSRNDEISAISRNLKGIAKEYNASVLALSQLSRALESRSNKRPILADLRESGGIEQDADVVVFLYRDVVYDPAANPREAEAIIAKQRNGPLGTVNLDWDAETTRFSSATRGAA